MYSTRRGFNNQLSVNDPNLNLAFYAALSNNLDLLHKSIELGEDLNVKDDYGLTPLHMATFGSFELVKCLVENGANVNAVNIHGYTPLFYSLYYNDTNLCRFLIDHGAKIDIRNRFGETPLYLATYLNNISGVRLLARLGADVNIMDDRGVCPMILALNMKNCNMLRCLARLGANINVLSKKGFTPLNMSIREKNLKLTHYLIKKGALIYDKDIFGASRKYLKVLSKSKNPENLKIIIKISLQLKDAPLLVSCLKKYYHDISRFSIQRVPFHLGNTEVNKGLNSLNLSLDKINEAKTFIHKLSTNYAYNTMKKMYLDPDNNLSVKEKDAIDTILLAIKNFKLDVYALSNTTIIDSFVLPARSMQKNQNNPSLST